MHADEPGAAIGNKLEARILHAERFEQILAEIDFERLATDLLDRLADEIDIDAVLPFLAGIESERHGERQILAGDDAGDPLLLLIAQQVRVPDVVAEARGMRDEMAQRDRPLRRAQLGLARAIEALEHLRRAQLGQYLADGTVERELAALDELHRRR